MTAIITPEQRLAEQHGAHILILGPNAVGKTTQAGKLDASPDTVRRHRARRAGNRRRSDAARSAARPGQTSAI